MTALSNVVHALAHVWYGWMGWLPGPLQVVSFIVAAFTAIRLCLRHGIPRAARIAAPLARYALRSLAWLAVAPEYAITSATLQYGAHDLRGIFAYGEMVAGLLDAAERGTGSLFRWLEKSQKLSAWIPLGVMAGVIILMNINAYQAHTPLPLSTWWHSFISWFTSQSQPT